MIADSARNLTCAAKNVGQDHENVQLGLVRVFCACVNRAVRIATYI